MKKIYKIFLLFLLTLNLAQTKAWTPEDLSKELKTFNSFIDPESQNQDINLVERIKIYYLKTNTIYEKIDLNFFYISKIHKDYLNRQSLFAQVLMDNVESNPDIDKENRKSSYLTIIFSLKQNIVIIYPSEKLIKILPHNIIQSISEEVSSVMKTKNYSKTAIYLFEQIDIYWNKYKNTNRIINKNKNKSKNSQNKHNDTSQGFIDKVINVVQIEHLIYYTMFFVLFVIIFFVLVVIIFYVRKWYIQKESKNNVNIKIDENCLICLESICVKGNKENFFTYEEICIKNLKHGKYVAVLKCGHAFHATCIAQWDNACKGVVSCPKCREKDLEKREEFGSQVSATTNSNFDVVNRVPRRIFPRHSLIEEPENGIINNVSEERRKIEEELLEEMRREVIRRSNNNNYSNRENLHRY